MSYKATFVTYQSKKNSIDKVLCINVLHHVKDLKAAIEEIRRILKKEGTIFVLDFHKKSLIGRMINLYEKTMLNPGLINLSLIHI